MFLKTYGLVGLEPIEVRVHVRSALATDAGVRLKVTGLPEASARELQVRVASALAREQVWCVAELEIDGWEGGGASFDLAAALAVLSELSRVVIPEGVVPLAELAFDGSLRPVRGVYAIASRLPRITRFLVARENANEHRNCDAQSSLGSVMREYVGESADVTDFDRSFDSQDRGRGKLPNADTVAQAAIEGRNLLLVGRPGSGRMILARHYHASLPNPDDRMAHEIMSVYSAAGILDVTSLKVPFRAPHHSVSEAGLIGGGDIPRPGECSLAHGGVLVLDDVTEFRSGAIKDVAHVTREGVSRLYRKGHAGCPPVSFPAQCRIVATANPCPCGHYGSASLVCRCPPESRARWTERLEKLSEALGLERVDLG